ncbi:hypothetical protein SCG7086_AG_00150 [Chlamydiales bacterium SCGC AG-110-P3]|nr:hypothetical protein SCG7086_AG_00150 [Chlamydiales bacterium SCGC AG-110-P3]
MSAGESDSIFDHASKMLGKKRKKKKPLKRKKPPKKDEVASDAVDKSEPKEQVFAPREPDIPAESGPLDDEELDARVVQARKMFEELQSKVDKVYETLDISPDKAEEVLSHPDLPDDIKKELDMTAATLEQDLFKGRFTEVRRRFSVAKQKKKVKRRRGKGIGGRKGWLPM